MQPLFVANWKMNMGAEEANSFLCAFSGTLENASAAKVVICPPFTTIPFLSKNLPDGVILGAQNIHWESKGAHTGEISAEMLAEAGVKYVIVGHSERRQFYGETNENVSKRAAAAIKNHIVPIVCIGESKEQFESGETKQVVSKQLRESLANIGPESAASLVVAYEPVWAIGTGLAATPEIAEGVHAFLREELGEIFGSARARVPLLYGGSTKPENIEELCRKPNINGALVGGASLKTDQFTALIENGLKAARS